MKNVKQFLAVLTAISLCASPIAVRAEDTTISNSSADKSANTLVSATINSQYSVRIPKTITLRSSASTKDSSYSVGAKGIISTSKVLYVAPYAVLSPDNSKVSIVSKNGNTVDLTVTQNKTYFKNSDLSNSYFYNDGQVSGTINQPGNYEGNMTFVVALENNPEIKQPGLYKDEELIYKFTDSLAKERNNLGAVWSNLVSKANTIVTEINNTNDARMLSTSDFQGKDYTFELLPSEYIAVDNNDVNLSSCLTYPKKLIIPEGVIIFKGDSSSRKESLEKVILPNSLVELGYGAFKMCPKLTSVTFPANLKKIGEAAFYNGGYGGTVNALGTIAFNDKLEYIGRDAFYNCNMETLSFPSSLKYIGGAAFYDCKKLKTVTFPEGAELMGVELMNECFGNCTELISANIPDNTFINAANGPIFNHDSKLKEITIGSNVHFVSSGGSCLLDFGNALNKIHFTGTKTPASNDDSSELIVTGTPEITFDNTITTIGKNCFRDTKCSNMTWPTGLVVVEDYAFRNATLPATDGKIVLPTTVKTIGKEAFAYVSGAGTVVIPDNVEAIGKNAFLGVNHIEYHGSLVDDGSHWGAASIN